MVYGYARVSTQMQAKDGNSLVNTVASVAVFLFLRGLPVITTIFLLLK